MEYIQIFILSLENMQTLIKKKKKEKRFEYCDETNTEGVVWFQLIYYVLDKLT